MQGLTLEITFAEQQLLLLTPQISSIPVRDECQMRMNTHNNPHLTHNIVVHLHRNSLSRIVHDKGVLTAPMAIKLAAALGNTPEFWLNIQHAVEIWDVRHSAYEKEAKNVRRVKPHPERGEVAQPGL